MSDESKGLRVLVVEDEFLIALDIQATLGDLGFRVAGLASDLDRALGAVEDDGVDAALLDINLGGTRSFDVASRLQYRGVPFAFLTGYENDVLPDEFADVPVLKKPFTRDDLARVLSRFDHPSRP